jgi:hypothetical protein
LSLERARFCPFCGAPVGSFFGRSDVTGAVWCEACEGWFDVRRVDDEGTDGPSSSLPENEDLTATGDAE